MISLAKRRIKPNETTTDPKGPLPTRARPQTMASGRTNIDGPPDVHRMECEKYHELCRDIEGAGASMALGATKGWHHLRAR
jgi:hypothetical protein